MSLSNTQKAVQIIKQAQNAICAYNRAAEQKQLPLMAVPTFNAIDTINIQSVERVRDAAIRKLINIDPNVDWSQIGISRESYPSGMIPKNI